MACKKGPAGSQPELHVGEGTFFCLIVKCFSRERIRRRSRNPASRKPSRLAERQTTGPPKAFSLDRSPGTDHSNGPAAATRSGCLKIKTAWQFSCHTNVNFLLSKTAGCATFREHVIRRRIKGAGTRDCPESADRSRGRTYSCGIASHSR
jgi:hypothetical protein